MFDNDDYPDYFIDDEPDSPAPAPAPAPQPQPQPSRVIEFADPGSDAPASDSSARRPRRSRAGCWFTLFMLFVVAAVIAYFRYLTPFVDDAVMDVYVTNVEKRGVFFKTYEARIVVPDDLESSDIYSAPSSVSIASPEVAARLQQLQSSRRPVRLRYCRYYATLPWRGESKTVVTAVEL